MKRKFLKENYNTLPKSCDFGRVLFYIGESVALYWRVLFYRYSFFANLSYQSLRSFG